MTLEKLNTEQKEQKTKVLCRYRLHSGQVMDATFYVSLDEMRKHGKISVGSRFTVLYLPEEAYVMMPYFQITAVSLPTTSEPIITPP